MRPRGAPGAQTSLGVDQVLLGEEVGMANISYRLDVKVERAWQDVFAWRIHSFFVGRVIWSITRMRRLGPYLSLLLL